MDMDMDIGKSNNGNGKGGSAGGGFLLQLFPHGLMNSYFHFSSSRYIYVMGTRREKIDMVM